MISAAWRGILHREPTETAGWGGKDESGFRSSEILLGMFAGKGSYGLSALWFTESPMNLPIRHV